MIKIDIVDFYTDRHTWIPEPTEKELGKFLSRLQVAHLKETLTYNKDLNGNSMNMETYLNSQDLGAFKVIVKTSINSETFISIIRAYIKE